MRSSSSTSAADRRSRGFNTVSTSPRPATSNRPLVGHPISLVVFDLLHLNGRSVQALPYDQRRPLLERLGLSGPQWGITPSFTDIPGSDVLRSAVGLGMEGVVAKRRASVYRPGARSRDWIKVKSQRTQEVVIGGWTAGKGETSGHLRRSSARRPCPRR